MILAITASQRPWISAVFAVLGVVCEITGHHDVAVSLITASITIATLAEKPPAKADPVPEAIVVNVAPGSGSPEAVAAAVTEAVQKRAKTERTE